MGILRQRDSISLVLIAAVPEFVNLRRVEHAAGGDGGEAGSGRDRKR